jgi:hypothetical protein
MRVVVRDLPRDFVHGCLAAIFATALVAIPTAAWGQETSPAFGLMGGAARHRLTSTVASETFHPEPGVTAGIYLGGIGGSTSRRAAPLLEVLLATRGVVSDFLSIHNYTYWVVDVPILAQVSVVRLERGGTAFFVAGGVAPGFRVSPVEVKRPDGSNVLLVGDRNWFDFSGIGGGGVHMGRVQIELRYLHGLRSLIASGPFAGELKSRSVQVLARFRLQ